jgi:hypothetical protein
MLALLSYLRVVMSQFELCASLECADLSALWPKRRQGAALQGGAQFKLRHHLSSPRIDTDLHE